MITSTGLSIVRDLIGYGNTDTIAYFGFGSGTTAPSLSDSGLEYEVSERRAVSYSNIGSPSVGDTYSCTLNSIEASGINASGYSISELGLFTQLTGGSMFNRCAFDAISLSSGSEYKFEWDILEI